MKAETTILDTGYFLTVVAKDQTIAKFGPGIKDWPADNWWALISTYKSNIIKDQIPGLMQHYKVDVLDDYERYFGEIPQENQNEKH